MRFAVSLLAVVIACAAAPALAGPPKRFGMPQPVQARIVGYLEHKPEGEIAEATWRVKVQGREHTWYVKRIQVLTGDVSYSNIVDDAKPYTVAYSIDAPKDLLQ